MFKIGTAASDNLVGADGEDLIDGQWGDDSLDGGGGDDFLYGGDGDDALTGNTGNDQLYGEGGNDYFFGDAGADTIDGGLGLDYVSYMSSSAGVTVDLVNGGLLGDAEGDAYVSIERVKGSVHADKLYGNALNNLFMASPGGDQIFGRGGVDGYVAYKTLDQFGQPLDSVIDLAAGYANRSVWDSSTSTLGQETDLLASIENVTGSSGNESVIGNAQDNLIDSGGGTDDLDGGTGFDYVRYNNPDVAFDAHSVEIDLQEGIMQALFPFSSVVASTSILAGFEAAIGSSFDDDLAGDGVSNRLDGLYGSDVLMGRGGDDHLVGGEGDDFLHGGIGNDLLDGGAGADGMDGGAGIDTVTYENSRGGVWVELLKAKGAMLLLDGVEQLEGESFGDRFLGVENLIGSAEHDVLKGDNAGNKIAGGKGDDELFGCGGDDVIYGDGDASATQAIHLKKAESTQDAVNSPDCGCDGNVNKNAVNGVIQIVPADLASGGVINPAESGDEIEGGDGNDYIAGQGGSDLLFGDCGNDTLLGGNEFDLLYGGSGNDVLEGGSSFDLLFGDEGFDIASYALSAQAVTVSLADGSKISGGDAASMLTDLLAMFVGSADVSDTYNSATAQSLIGLLNTTIGTDPAALQLFQLADILISIEGLVGSALADKLTGSVGDNLLDGGTGGDTLTGLGGNDTYVVDSLKDIVVEAANAGIDTVQSSKTYVLGANIEKLVLTGSKAVNGTGNELNNTLVGNAQANLLNGGAGNDYLNGGAGADTLSGGQGNDTYVVDNPADVVQETSALSGEIDTVQSGVTFSLASQANIEKLVLTGTSAINAAGNALNNILVGNSANNVLNGMAGNDTMSGGSGNDTYHVDAAGDVVKELAVAGYDSVVANFSYTLGANIEKLTFTGNAAINGIGNELNNSLIGNTGANSLRGGAGNDSIIGNGGVDMLYGGTGNDTLNGGAGADRFVFDSTLNAAGNVDIIQGFAVIDDTIWLDNDIFASLVTENVVLSQAAFHKGAGVTSAHDADDLIIYNTTTGALFYDADANGSLFSPVKFAVMGTTTHPALTAQDFFVVA